MHAYPHAANPLVPGVVAYGLKPISFGLKPYLELCHKFDRALVELEKQYPGKPRVITLSTRNKMLKRRPK